MALDVSALPLASCSHYRTRYTPPEPVAISGAPSGVVNLAWDAPPREPNPLRNPVGYRIYYGKDPDRLDLSVDVKNVTRHRLEGLKPGATYYFYVRSYNSDEIESEASNTVSTDVE